MHPRCPRIHPLNKSLPSEKNFGFVFESEVLIEACRHGYGVVSVPIASCYPTDRRKSHFRPLLDICRITRMVAIKLLKWGLYPQGLVRSLVERPVIVRDI